MRRFRPSQGRPTLLHACGREAARGARQNKKRQRKRQNDAVASPPPTKSRRLNHEDVFPEASPPATANFRTFGRCGVWKTVEPCWSPTTSFAARTTSMAKSPACSAAASSAWRSSPRSPIWSMSSACPSTKSACLLNFFQNLQLSKSQADALLHQLSRHWHTSSTCSARCWPTRWWCMPTRPVGASTASGRFSRRRRGCCCSACTRMPTRSKQLLDPATFAGIVISDDAAVYANFTAVAKVLGASAAQGDQADPARPGQRRLPALHGSTAGDLPRGVPRPARWPAQRRGAGTESRRRWRTRSSICATPMWLADLPPLRRTRQRLSPAGQ